MDNSLLQSLAAITDEERLLLAGSAVDKRNYATGNAFTVDSVRMLEKGELIALRPHTRFAFFPRHSHNYVEMMYMCSGKTVHTMNGDPDASITLRAGELLLMNQHASHTIEKADVEDIAVNFIILPQFFHIAFEMIGTDNVLGRFLLGSMQASTPAPSYLHFATAGVLPVQNLLENMVWTIANKTTGARRINQYTMGVLFLQLLNYTDHLAAGRNTAHTPCVVAALREIEENYATASLSQVAALHHVSAAYLSGLVREETGSTFTTLLQQKRLARAAQLLQGSPLSIQSIIEAVGYDNSSYFYRIFRESFGISPKEYRKNSAEYR